MLKVCIIIALIAKYHLDSSCGGTSIQNEKWEGGIAIVDDEVAIVDMYSKILTASSIPIAFVAQDGEDAIRKFEESDPKPQVVIMDYRMPAMNGLEASKKIWKIEPSTKIIFISADSGVREEALKAGASAFIQKPASLRDIVLEVKCVISKL